MDYIGSKNNLLDFIVSTITKTLNEKGENVADLIFCDLFSGTGIVARHFKQQLSEKGKVIANDLQHYSYVLNKHYLGNNKESKIDIDKLNALNNLPLVKTGFITENYSPRGNRLFFTEDNARFCDTVRLQIEQWYQEKEINEETYYFLLASLLESIDKYSNTSGVYAAYLKSWQQNALRNAKLSPAPIITGKIGEVYKENALSLIENISGDVLYLDPPYNTRQYCDNYHLLETIAQYDNPEIKGVAGLRADNIHFKSAFSRKREAKDALTTIINKANFRYVFLSYNNEGIVSPEEIKKIMSSVGEYKCFEKVYKRFKSNLKGDQAATVTEFLHFVEKA